MLKIWNERWHLIRPGDASQTVVYAVEHFLAVAHESIAHHGAFYVALSGGSTPKAIFQKLFHSPYKEMIPWDKVHIFFSDERAVPHTHPDSNYQMAMQAGLGALAISEKNIHRMIAEENIEENARGYEVMIRETLKEHSFDLIMLGLGEDGHTASLFSGTKALSEHKRWILENFVPEKQAFRMTMTYPLINKARHAVFYVMGSSKKKIIKEIFSSHRSDQYPAEKVGTREHPALWIVDHDAALELFVQK